MFSSNDKNKKRMKMIFKVDELDMKEPREDHGINFYNKLKEFNKQFLEKSLRY